ncbi:MAG: hypothetical protein N2D54_01530, partial [Chloroflexota bacterium]
MKKFINIIILIAVLGGMFAFPGAVSAKPERLPNYDDKVVISGTYTLKEGEALEGSLVAIGAIITLEEG